VALGSCLGHEPRVAYSSAKKDDKKSGVCRIQKTNKYILPACLAEFILQTASLLLEPPKTFRRTDGGTENTKEDKREITLAPHARARVLSNELPNFV